MAKCEKRPSWFKVFLHQKPLFDSVPDEVVGKAVKAAMHYFDTREQLELEPLPMAVFCTIKPYIDESFADYDRDVKNGKKGGRPPKPSVTPVNPGLPMQTEAEADKKQKEMPEGDTITADKPPKPIRHKYGEYKNVLLTDEELSKLQAEIPCWKEMIERLSSYMESSGKKYKNHLATMRTWYRKDQPKTNGKNPMPDYGGEGNWSL